MDGYEQDENTGYDQEEKNALMNQLDYVRGKEVEIVQKNRAQKREKRS